MFVFDDEDTVFSGVGVVVLPKPNDKYGRHDHHCQGKCDDNMRRGREKEWDQTQHVCEQNEHKQGENEREKLEAVFAGR